MKPTSSRTPGTRPSRPAGKTTPPGTDAIGRVIGAAGAPVLLLFDEILNFLNRHQRGARLPVVPFPDDGAAIPDTPRLTLMVVDPELEWTGAGRLREGRERRRWS